MLGFGSISEWPISGPGVDAAAAGIIQTCATSLIPGTATGNVNQAGSVLTATGSLVSGTAAGAADTVGSVLPVQTSIEGGQFSAAANVSGQLLSISASVVSGQPTAETPIVFLVSGGSTHAKLKSVDVIAAGSSFVVVVSVIAGVASGAQNVIPIRQPTDEEFLVLLAEAA